MTSLPNDRIRQSDRVWDMIWKIITILILPWAIWMSTEVISLGQDVAVIQGNRFTSRDAVELQTFLATELGKRPTRAELEARLQRLEE